MKVKMFRGSLQQDAQEFLRCLLTQIHDEIGVHVPPPFEASGDPSGCHRDSMASCGSRDSECSNGSGDSQTKLMVSGQNSAPTSKKRSSIISLSSSSSRQKLSSSAPNSAQSSPYNQPKFSLRSSYTRIRGSSGSKSSTESINKLSSQRSVSQNSLASHTSESSVDMKEPALKWLEGDAFVVDIITRKVTHHTDYPLSRSRSPALPSAAKEEGTQTAPGSTQEQDEVVETALEEGVPIVQTKSTECQGGVTTDINTGERVTADASLLGGRQTKMDEGSSAGTSSPSPSPGEDAVGSEEGSPTSSKEDGSKEESSKEGLKSSSKEGSLKEGALRSQPTAPNTLSGKKKNGKCV